MKKKYLIILFIALLGFSVSSCKSKQACPAYGYVEVSEEVNG